jgi:pimeloyl-ACP methyl ester carboxylesterase
VVADLAPTINRRNIMEPQISRAGVRVRGFDDPELDFQMLRQLGSVASGGASVGETFAAGELIAAGGQSSWTSVFAALAQRQLADADKRAGAGHLISARDQYLKACNSFRSAEYFSPPGAPSTQVLGHSTRAAFLQALAAGDQQHTELTCTVDGADLPGLFLPTPAASATRRLLIIVSGFDGTMEESYLQAGIFGLERGWNILFIAGPGQADTRRRYPDSTFVPDTERWITPWLDLAGELPGIDPNRIALLGLSFGGYFALRAAAHDPRFAAVVADSPIVDLHAYNQAFVGFDPEQVLGESDDFGAEQLPDIPDEELPPAMKDLTRALLARFGQRTFVGIFRYLRNFCVDPASVTVPALGLVGAGEGPEPMRQYQELMTKSGGSVTGHIFTKEEGGSSHCQLDNLAFSAAVIYDWLDDTVPA